MQTNNDAKIRELLENVGKLLAEKKQGFLFSAFSTEKGVDDEVANCITTKDPEEFWLGMVPLVFNMSRVCPEDQRDEFRKGFLAFIELIIDECFPSMQIKG